jgi:hypothetical protein
MHASGNDDVDNKTSNEMTRKIGNRINRATTHTWTPSYSPKLKSLQDLSIRFKVMVIEEVVDDAGLWFDGGTQHRLSASLSLHRVLGQLDPLHQ